MSSTSDRAGRIVAAPLSRCAVRADAGESVAADGSRGAPLNCVAVGEAARSAGTAACADERPSAMREGRTARTGCRKTPAPTFPRSHRRHVGCMGRCAPRHSAATLRSPSNRRAGCSGRPWPSPFGVALRSGTLGVLPRACVHPLRACTRPLPAGARRVRWSRTPRAPAAPHRGCRPHPRIARNVLAPAGRCRARSRGYRRPRDITRNCAAHLLCVQARHAASCRVSPGPCRGVRRSLLRPLDAAKRERSPRARVIRRYVTWPPARPCACQGAPLLRRVACASCTRRARLRAVHGLLPRSASGGCARVQCAAPLRPRPRAPGGPSCLACGRLTPAAFKRTANLGAAWVRTLEAKSEQRSAGKGREARATARAAARDVKSPECLLAVVVAA